MRTVLPVLILLPCIACDGDGLCKEENGEHTGYLSAGEDVEYFYYLAASRSSTPDTDALVLWLTGGPGCSSILALLTENGPCRVLDRNAATGEFTFERNPSSWNELGNVLWVDQPVGVGYSTPGDASQLVQLESQVADRMVQFLINFYRKFPHFLQVPLLITGESYSGHFVPAIASRVLDYQHNGIATLFGVAIGNALVDPTLQFASKPEMAYTGGRGGSLGRGVVSTWTHQEMQYDLATCEQGIKTCQQNPKWENACVSAYMTCVMSEIQPIQLTGLNPYDMREPCNTPPGQHSVPCQNFTLETQLLNDAKIKERLGVPSWRTWEACNMTVVLPFVVSGDELFTYHRQVSRLLAAGVDVLVYAGDTDFMVDWIGCKAWVKNLDWEHRQEWTSAPNLPFKVGGATAGMKQTFNSLSYVQIYNSGHMVPMNQPKVALEMMRTFLAQALATPPRAREDLAAAMDSVALPMVAAALAILALTVALLRRLSCWKHQEGSYHLLA